MGVPRRFPSSTENSARFSYDGGYIQIIPNNFESIPWRPADPVYEPPTFYNSDEANNGGFSNNDWKKDLDDLFDDDTKLLYNRLRQVLNNTLQSRDNYPWLSSTSRESKIFHIDFSEPTIKVPEVDSSNLALKQSPVFHIWLIITSVLLCILCILRLILCYQRAPYVERSLRRLLTEQRQTPSILRANVHEHNSAHSSLTFLINSDFSLHTDSHSDSPPSYFECRVNDNGIDNTCLDVTSEEPPAYSTCIKTLNNADGIVQIHKRQSTQEAQSHTDTDIHLNSSDSNCDTNVEQNDGSAGPLSREIETTIVIGNDELTRPPKEQK